MLANEVAMPRRCHNRQVGHGPRPGKRRFDLVQIAHRFDPKNICAAFGEATCLVGEGDLTAHRFQQFTGWPHRTSHQNRAIGFVGDGTAMRAAATGKEVTVTGMNLFHIRDGQISEMWLNADDLGELQQLGVVATA